jgi:hypothetical protein
MARKPLLLVLAAVILAGAVAGALWWRWYTSPRYSLHQMVLALKTGNLNKFFKYVDLKEIVASLAASSSKDLPPPEPGGDEWDRFGQQLGRKFAQKFLPKLFQAFDKQARALLESYLRSLDNTQILALAAAVSTARIEVQDDEAEVTVLAPKTKEPLRFTMRRQADTDTWVIVAVNYADLKKFVKRELKD